MSFTFKNLRISIKFYHDDLGKDEIDFYSKVSMLHYLLKIIGVLISFIK